MFETSLCANNPEEQYKLNDVCPSDYGPRNGMTPFCSNAADRVDASNLHNASNSIVLLTCSPILDRLSTWIPVKATAGGLQAGLGVGAAACQWLNSGDSMNKCVPTSQILYGGYFHSPGQLKARPNSGIPLCHWTGNGAIRRAVFESNFRRVQLTAHCQNSSTIGVTWQNPWIAQTTCLSLKGRPALSIRTIIFFMIWTRMPRHRS